jgi:hypothetical protein
LLSVEFKIEPQVNSGIFFRISGISDFVQKGIEMQVLDSYGREVIGKKDCGAVYDLLAPSVNAVRPAGEWNHAEIECRGSLINIRLNGEHVIAMNMDLWDSPGQNPDGSPNKFKHAIRDLPHRGHIGLQNHGGSVWYKNIKLLPL